MSIPQRIKDLVGPVTATVGRPAQGRIAPVQITNDDSHTDGTVRIEMDGWWIDADDCLALSVYFKRLGKAVRKNHQGI